MSARSACRDVASRWAVRSRRMRSTTGVSVSATPPRTTPATTTPHSTSAVDRPRIVNASRPIATTSPPSPIRTRERRARRSLACVHAIAAPISTTTSGATTPAVSGTRASVRGNTRARARTRSGTSTRDQRDISPRPSRGASRARPTGTSGEDAGTARTKKRYTPGASGPRSSSTRRTHHGDTPRCCPIPAATPATTRSPTGRTRGGRTGTGEGMGATEEGTVVGGEPATTDVLLTP